MKQKFRPLKFLIFAILSTVITFLWPSTTYATQYIAGWSPPQTEYWIRQTGDILYSPINSYGCFGNDTNNGQGCGFGSGGYSSYGYQPSNHSIGYHLYLLKMKSSNAQTPSIHGKGHIARVQFSVSMPTDNGTPNVQFLGSSYLLNGGSGEPWYFPLGVENISTSKLYSTENPYPWEYVTTFDVLFVQLNDVTGGIPAFFPNIYVGSTAGQSSAFIRVDNVVYYTDADQYAADSSSTLTDIKSIVENIQNNSSNAGVIQQQTITNEKLDDINQQFDDARNEAEQAQQQSQTDGNSSQQQADLSGQTLLNALQSFIGALNVQPGSCVFTLNTGYGFNLGAVNLCSISPPPAFQVISSLVVIGFAVPLSISASKKMIELFRGFTG